MPAENKQDHFSVNRSSISDDDIVALHVAKATNKDIAKQAGVTVQAIGKKLKTLAPKIREAVLAKDKTSLTQANCTARNLMVSYGLAIKESVDEIDAMISKSIPTDMPDKDLWNLKAKFLQEGRNHTESMQRMSLFSFDAQHKLEKTKWRALFNYIWDMVLREDQKADVRIEMARINEISNMDDDN